MSQKYLGKYDPCQHWIELGLQVWVLQRNQSTLPLFLPLFLSWIICEMVKLEKMDFKLQLELLLEFELYLRSFFWTQLLLAVAFNYKFLKSKHQSQPVEVVYFLLKYQEANHQAMQLSYLNQFFPSILAFNWAFICLSKHSQQMIRDL